MGKGSFILDFNLLREQDLTVEEFIVLICIISGQDHSNDCTSLQEKQFIKITENNEIILREKGRLFVELISIDKDCSSRKVVKKSSDSVNEELETFATEFRLLWKGKKPGSMGSLTSCTHKLYRWMQENPTFTKDEILRAAKLYLNTLNDNTYLQRADYFIFKIESSGQENSRLSAFIEEIDEKPVDDWTNTLI